MLVDIPDVGTMIGVFIAFVLGVFAIIIYKKVRPLIRTEPDLNSYTERLQYYENQLIDMKIRLDSVELLKEFQEPIPIPKPKEVKIGKQEIVSSMEERPRERIHNMNFGNATDYVLRLITEKPMTSRDIQITIGRTREHTSRMMKKFFEEGLVERNMKTKPFTYYITDKGKAKLGIMKIAPQQ